MPRPRATTPTYTLFLRGNTYYVRWWEDGRAQRTSCNTTNKIEAETFRDALIVGLTTEPPPVSPNVGAILDGYAAARSGKVHSDAITYAVKSLKRHLEYAPTDTLSPERIAMYIAARRKEGSQAASAQYRKKPKALSDGTLRRELGVLRTALGWAVKAKWITTAPTFDLPPTQPGRKRWLTKEEANKLFSACETLHVKVFLALALFTAGRMGAILELTWDRVDDQAGRISLSTGESRGKKRRQTVPIADGLKPYLAEARQARTCAYVVEWHSKPMVSVKVGVRNAVMKAELKGVTAHVMRHTAATWMLQAGVPIKQVADYLGDTVAMIEKHYGQHSPAHLREGAAALTL